MSTLPNPESSLSNLDEVRLAHSATLGKFLSAASELRIERNHWRRYIPWRLRWKRNAEYRARENLAEAESKLHASLEQTRESYEEHLRRTQSALEASRRSNRELKKALKLVMAIHFKEAAKEGSTLPEDERDGVLDMLDDRVERISLGIERIQIASTFTPQLPLKDKLCEAAMALMPFAWHSTLAITDEESVGSLAIFANAADAVMELADALRVSIDAQRSAKKEVQEELQFIRSKYTLCTLQRPVR